MNKKQSILPPEKEIERVCQIVNKPNFRRVNIGLTPQATEAEKIKHDLCKSIARYQRENKLEEETLSKKLAITQTQLEISPYYEKHNKEYLEALERKGIILSKEELTEKLITDDLIRLMIKQLDQKEDIISVGKHFN